MFSNALNVVLNCELQLLPEMLNLQIVAEERAVFLRDQACDMYSVSAYFVAKSAVSLPFMIGSAIGFATISYFIVGERFIHLLFAQC